MPMIKATTISKKDRPKVVERILREGRARDPGTWVSWKDILAAVGGSERDLSGMIRAAKDRILAEEASMAQLPELPDEMKADCERFVLEIWRKSCELNDSNASAERRARQADRARWEDERIEHDEVVAALVDERDCLKEKLAASEAALKERAADLAAKEELLVEERRLRAAAEAASSELRLLFENLTGATAPNADEASLGGQSVSKDTEKTTPKSSRRSSNGKVGKGEGSPDDDGPETPPLPMS
jgi:hypothetical protein